MEEINSGNEQGDKFLFFFSPSKVAIDCFCCCNLKTGAKVISFLLLFSSCSNFIDAFTNKSRLVGLISLVNCVLDGVAAFYLFLSIVNLKSEYAKTAYLAFLAHTLIQLSIWLLVSVFMLFGIFQPVEKMVVLAFVTLIFAYLLLALFSVYLLWVIFSIKVLLEQGNLDVVLGTEYVKYVDAEEDEKKKMLEVVEEEGK